MSECVVRMEMPAEHCMDCRYMVSRDNDDCILQSDEANERAESWEDLKAGCPFICALPEGHGRLVDADTFSGHMKEYRERIMKWREQSKMEGPDESYHRADSALLTVVATKLILENAPTIVPAEAESQSPKPTDPLPIRGVEYVPTEVDVQTGTVTYELRERSET